MEEISCRWWMIFPTRFRKQEKLDLSTIESDDFDVIMNIHFLLVHKMRVWFVVDDALL